jgi:hypothetical protein
VLLVLHADGDVPYQYAALGPDDINCADVAAYLADAGGQPAKHTGAILDLTA